MLCTIKKTFAAIVASGNNYVICVKRNQKNLYDQMEEVCSKWPTNICYKKTEEQNRGRHEIRKLYVYEANLEIENKWPGANTIVKLTRERSAKGDKKGETHTWFYICSKEFSGKMFQQGIRGHWLIENRLHWVKDVVMKEDGSKIKNNDASSIMSIINTIVLNLIRQKGHTKIKDFMMIIAHEIEQMLRMTE